MARRKGSRKDLTGIVSGRLVVLKLDEKADHRRGTKWLCKCSCGNICSVNGSRLYSDRKTKQTISCGCAQRESARLRKGRSDYHGKSYTPEYQAYTHARKNASKRGRDFDITVHDLHVPEICPLLAIPIKTFPGRLCDNSASVDRIDTTKGYVKGNVWVVSNKANRIKSNATLAELEMLVSNLRLEIERRKDND